eukprot:8295357-Pyramimonas_sp.AAC.1
MVDCTPERPAKGSKQKGHDFWMLGFPASRRLITPERPRTSSQNNPKGLADSPGEPHEGPARPPDGPKRVP